MVTDTIAQCTVVLNYTFSFKHMYIDLPPLTKLGGALREDEFQVPQEQFVSETETTKQFICYLASQ